MYGAANLCSGAPLAKGEKADTVPGTDSETSEQKQ